MFLFFTCSRYDAEGGVHDLLGKSEGDTWQHLMDVMSANEEVNEFDLHDELEDVDEYEPPDRLRDEVHVLNLETMQRQVASIKVEYEDDGSFTVKDFHPYKGSEGMLAGIPYEVEPEPPKGPYWATQPRVTMDKALYYKIAGTTRTALLGSYQEVDCRRFEFIVKRHPENPNGDKVSESYVLETYLQRHGEAINAEHGAMNWYSAAQDVVVIKLTDFILAKKSSRTCQSSTKKPGSSPTPRTRNSVEQFSGKTDNLDSK